MPLTTDDIIAEAYARRFPRVLCRSEWVTGVLNPALRAMNASQGITVYGTFNSAVDVQDYAIFDPDDEATTGFAQNCTRILNVYYNPSGNIANDIFSPYWELTREMLRYGGFFHNPSQTLILQSKLAMFRSTWGEQGWETFGPFGLPEGRLRLYNVPGSITGVIVEYETKYAVETVEPTKEYMLWEWIEYYFAEAMANYYSQTAGIQLLGFSTPSDALRYWADKAVKKQAAAITSQRGIHGQVEVS